MNDEPDFILRAQDMLAPSVIDYWISLAAAHGVSRHKIERAIAHRDAVVVWQRKHGYKLPD